MWVKVPSSLNSSECECGRWWHSRYCIDLQQLLLPTETPKNTLKHGLPVDRISFLLQGQSVTEKYPSKHTHTHTQTRERCVLRVLQSKLYQSCFCKMFNFSRVNGWEREGTDSTRNLPKEPKCNVWQTSVYFPGPRGLVASPAWESAA